MVKSLSVMTRIGMEVICGIILYIGYKEAPFSNRGYQRDQ